MSELVNAGEVERVVGVPRHPTYHIARAVSAEQTVYVLHSQQCLDSGIDLRMCPFSLALDNGIRLHEWTEDKPLPVAIRCSIEGERLVPNVP